MWSELDSSEEAVRTLIKNKAKKHPKLKNQKEKDIFKLTVFHIIQTPSTDGRKYDLINKTHKFFNDIEKEIKKNKLNIQDNSLENSKKITRAIECILDAKKEEEKESESLQLLKAGYEKIKKSKEILNHKVTREELNRELDKIENLIKKFKKYLISQGIK